MIRALIVVAFLSALSLADPTPVETLTTAFDKDENVLEVHTPKPIFELNPEAKQWIEEEEEAILSMIENPVETGKTLASKTINGIETAASGVETVASKGLYGLETVASGTFSGLKSIASKTIDILGNFLNK